MKHSILFFISLFFMQFVFSQSFLKTKGKYIVDEKGNKIVLKGVNIGNWLVPEGYMFKLKKTNAPSQIHLALTQVVGEEQARVFWKKFQQHYITHADIKYIKRMGANHIRFPFHYALLSEADYLGENKHGFALFDKLIGWCEQEGLYVLLDMHCAPGGQTGDNIDDSRGYPFLFSDKSAQDEFVNIWVQIAERYMDKPIIAGYDLLNEPIAHFFKDDLEKLNKELEPLYKRAVAAIRKVDKKHMIFVGGSQWNTNFSVFGKPFDDNLVYEFHKYWMPTEQKEIQAYLDFRDEHNVPLYLGESGENTDEWVTNFRKLLDKHDISWAFWPYKKLNNTKGPMNFNVSKAYYDHWVKFAESDRSSYKAIREQKIDRSVFPKIFEEYLEQCKYENCFPNEGYIKALGFVVPEKIISVSE